MPAKMHPDLEAAVKRTKSPFPDRDPSDPEDASVQILIRVPHWYYMKLQKTAPRATVPGIVLDLLGRQVSQVKPRPRRKVTP
jgi:hypothetical protein